MDDQSSFTASCLWLLESLSPIAPALPSSSAANALELLKPECRLLPTHQSARAKALAFCSRIAYVRIQDAVKIDGSTYYAIEMFDKKPISNIPTARRLPPLDTVDTATPDAIKLQRFSTFINLRHEMAFHANVGHSAHPCAFCSAMTRLVSESPSLPRLSLKLFHGHDSVTHTLEQFLNAVLVITKNSLSTMSDQRLCDGQREIPLLLERFLLQKEGGDDTKPHLTQSRLRQRPQGSGSGNPVISKII